MTGNHLNTSTIEALKCRIPLIVSGGVNSIDEITALFSKGVNGVAVGAFFTFASPKRGVLISYLSSQDFQQINSLSSH